MVPTVTLPAFTCAASPSFKAPSIVIAPPTFKAACNGVTAELVPMFRSPAITGSWKPEKFRSNRLNESGVANSVIRETVRPEVVGLIATAFQPWFVMKIDWSGAGTPADQFCELPQSPLVGLIQVLIFVSSAPALKTINAESNTDT